MDGTLHHERIAWCDEYCSFFSENCYSYYLSFNLKHILNALIQFEVNVANSVAIYVGNNVLLV